MAFCALWLFGVPNAFGSVVNILTLIVFFLGIGHFFWRDIRKFRFPSIQDIDRRIETDSQVANRPLSGIEDQLANDEHRGTRELWSRSRSKLLELINQLRRPKIRGVLAQRDPYALRLGIFMVFILGLIAAGPEWSYRIRDGLIPISFENEKRQGQAERFNIIITAPEYTTFPQIILNGNTKECYMSISIQKKPILKKPMKELTLLGI